MRARRWDIVIVVLIALVAWLAAFSAEGLFLHFDMPTQDVAALSWGRGCWEYNTSKILPVFLLTPLFRTFGPSVWWEMSVLGIASTVSVTCIYELARLFTKTQWTGLLAALLVTALPAFQYFSRIHLGYPMPFLLSGWLLAYQERWALAGAFFGLAITAHYNSWVPVGLTVMALATLILRRRSWKVWLKFGVALVAPLLAVDGLFFLYSGELFQWNVGVFNEVLRLSHINSANPYSDWAWLWRMVAGSNGWLLATLLAFALFAPLSLRRDKVGVAMSVTFLGLAVLYTIQAGIGRAYLASRLLATSYPFWAIGSASVFVSFWGRLSSMWLRRLGLGIVILGLVWAAIQSLVFIRRFGQTPYRQVGRWIEAAAWEGRSVRYMGNMWVGLLYAQLKGTEILVNDTRWIEENAAGQAVLIFDGMSPARLSRAAYRIEVAEVSAALDGIYPELTAEAMLPRRFEVWWPSGPSAPLGSVENLPPYAVYYSGSGCITPRPFGHGTLYFYQLAWNKLATMLSQ